jgi:hypothetical protein
MSYTFNLPRPQFPLVTTQPYLKTSPATATPGATTPSPVSTNPISVQPGFTPGVPVRPTVTPPQSSFTPSVPGRTPTATQQLTYAYSLRSSASNRKGMSARSSFTPDPRFQFNNYQRLPLKGSAAIQPRPAQGAAPSRGPNVPAQGRPPKAGPTQGTQQPTGPRAPSPEQILQQQLAEVDERYRQQAARIEASPFAKDGNRIANVGNHNMERFALIELYKVQEVNAAVESGDMGRLTKVMNLVLGEQERAFQANQRVGLGNTGLAGINGQQISKQIHEDNLHRIRQEFLFKNDLTGQPGYAVQIAVKKGDYNQLKQLEGQWLNIVNNHHDIKDRLNIALNSGLGSVSEHELARARRQGDVGAAKQFFLQQAMALSRNQPR